MVLAGNVNTQSINQAANLAFAPWEQMLETEKSATIDVYTLVIFRLFVGDESCICLNQDNQD